MLKRNSRLESLYRMGQTSSQVLEHNSDTENGHISDGAERLAGAEVRTEARMKGKNRKNLEATDDADDTQAVGDEVESTGCAKRKKKKKQKRKSADTQETSFGSNDVEEEQAESSRVEGPDDVEAESARTLLQLRNDTQRDSAQPPDETDFTASARSIAESSPAGVREKSKKLEIAEEIAGEVAGEKPDKAKHSRKRVKKSQRATQEIEIDGNAPPEDTEFTLSKVSVAHKVSTYRPTPSREPQNLPQSTVSLDDIDSNDEALAPFLQSYENGELNTRFNVPSQEGGPDIDHSYTQLANDAFNEASAAALRTELSSPLPSQKSQKGAKTGRKRNSNLPDGIFATDNEQGEQPLEESEQTLRKRSHKKRANKPGIVGKDALYGLYGIKDNFANYRNVFIDEGWMVDPQPTIPGHSTMQINNYVHSDPDTVVASQKAKSGRLNRPSKVTRKRSKVQSTNLDGYVTRDQNGPRSSPNADDGQDQSAHDSDPNIDPGPFSSAPKRKKRRVDPVVPPNASKPTFKISKSREANPSSQSQADAEPSTSGRNPNGGPFNKSESDLIYAWRESYCAEHQWSHQKFGETVQANARNDNTLNRFWTEICEQIPYRPRQAIQKFCRRRFHNFEKRGTWTPEEDEMLRRAVAARGKSWKAISDVMGRLQEDCRDRWRNYLYQSENRNTDAWTEDEVKALVKAVGECMWLMQNELQEQRDLELQRTGVARDRVVELLSEDQLEKLINWQVVSDRMQGQRSRLQCSYKWSKLKIAGLIDFKKAARKANREMSRLAQGYVEQPGTTRKDWRARKSRKKIEAQMLTGDKLDFLQALSHHRAKEEHHIIWATVGKGEPWRKKWDSMDLRVAWIMMKEEVGEELPLRDRYPTVVNNLIEKLLVEQSGTTEHRWFLDDQADRQTTELENLLAPVQEEVRGPERWQEQEHYDQQMDGPASTAGDEDMDEYEQNFDAIITRKLAELDSGVY